MKRISIVLTLLFLAIAPYAMAQEAGDIEVTLVLGNNTMVDQQNQSMYLLPSYSNTSATPGTGLGNAAISQSSDPGVFLNLTDIGVNSILNAAGIQGRYFLSPNIDVNMMFAMNIYATPSKDYIEGVSETSPLAIPAQRYIQGRLQSNLQFNVGGDYHFHVGKNNNLNAYVGANVGYFLGRIQTVNPYMGDQEGELIKYKIQSQAGQVMGLQTAIVSGITAETSIGLVIGIEVAPLAYQYSLYQIGPSGFQTYKANHHSLRFLSMPCLKFGFRF